MRAMRLGRALGLLALLLTACGGGADMALDGLWYGDDGRAVVIADGEVRLDSGELVASLERLGDDALRYEPASGDTARTLQVEFPTTLRMTWTELDGTLFRELTRVAGPE